MQEAVAVQVLQVGLVLMALQIDLVLEAQV
jgi:hypothetical protein